MNKSYYTINGDYVNIENFNDNICDSLKDSGYLNDEGYDTCSKKNTSLQDVNIISNNNKIFQPKFFKDHIKMISRDIEPKIIKRYVPVNNDEIIQPIEDVTKKVKQEIPQIPKVNIIPQFPKETKKPDLPKVDLKPNIPKNSRSKIRNLKQNRINNRKINNVKKIIERKKKLRSLKKIKLENGNFIINSDPKIYINVNLDNITGTINDKDMIFTWDNKEQFYLLEDDPDNGLLFDINNVYLINNFDIQDKFVFNKL